MYVGTRKLGRAGRLAGAYRLSSARRIGRRLSAAQADAIVSQRLAQLDYTLPIDVSGELTPVPYTPISSPIIPSSTPTMPTLAPSSSAPATNWTNILTSAINASGAIGVQALKPTPSVTYNPATGVYSATGGATLPTNISSLSSLSSMGSFLPLLLLGGVVLVVVSMARK